MKGVNGISNALGMSEVRPGVRYNIAWGKPWSLGGYDIH